MVSPFSAISHDYYQYRAKQRILNSTFPPNVDCRGADDTQKWIALPVCLFLLLDVTMASLNSGNKATAVAAPPHPVVVGFDAQPTSTCASEASPDSSGASPHSLPESPLSRLLRSATWPALRVRLCKSQIPAAGVPNDVYFGGSECFEEQSFSVSRQSRGSTPISIPRICR